MKKKFIIEEKIPSVFIDVSRSSILSAVEYFCEIFEFKDNKILIREKADIFLDEPVLEYFNYMGVGDEIKQEIIGLLEDA